MLFPIIGRRGRERRQRRRNRRHTSSDTSSFRRNNTSSSANDAPSTVDGQTIGKNGRKTERETSTESDTNTDRYLRRRRQQLRQLRKALGESTNTSSPEPETAATTAARSCGKPHLSQQLREERPVESGIGSSRALGSLSTGYDPTNTQGRSSLGAVAKIFTRQASSVPHNSLGTTSNDRAGEVSISIQDANSPHVGGFASSTPKDVPNLGQQLNTNELGPRRTLKDHGRNYIYLPPVVERTGPNQRRLLTGPEAVKALGLRRDDDDDDETRENGGRDKVGCRLERELEERKKKDDPQL